MLSVSPLAKADAKELVMKSLAALGFLTAVLEVAYCKTDRY
jgi:hypothetical protein